MGVTEQKIDQRRQAVDITTNVLGIVFEDKAASYLSQAFAGNKEFSKAEAAKLDDILTELEAIAVEHSPWVVNFNKNAQFVKQAVYERIAARKAARLASLPKGVSVFVDGPDIRGAYFQRRNESGGVMVAGYQSAAVMTETVARQLIEKLAQVGFRGQTSPAREVDFVHEELSSLWPETSNDEPRS